MTIFIFLEQNRLAVLIEKDASVESFRIKGEVLYDFDDKSEAIKTVASYIQYSMQLQSFDSVEVYIFSQETDEEFRKVVSEAFKETIVNLLPYAVIDQFVELAVTKDLLEAEKLNAEVSKVNKELNSEINELKASTQDLDKQLGNSSKLINKLKEKNKKLQEFYDNKTKTRRKVFEAKVEDDWVEVNCSKKSGDYIKTGEEIATYKKSSYKPTLEFSALIGAIFPVSSITNTAGSGYIYWLWEFNDWFQPKDYIYKNKNGLLALAVISSKKDDTMEDIEEFVKQTLS